MGITLMTYPSTKHSDKNHTFTSQDRFVLM